jgi:non-ribosomal peptide synthetase component F
MDHCYGLIKSANLKACKSYAITAPIVFDAGHSLIHTCIIQAATIHLLPDEVILDSEQLIFYLQKKHIDCLKIVPSLWLSHSESGSIPLPVKKLIFGGENFPISILPLLKSNAFQGDVFNHYGPTEASIGKCIYQIDLDYPYTQVPIGRPFSNTFLLVLDSKLKTVNSGEVGELYIGGEGIARGYLNLPKATAEVFIPDFFSGQNGGLLYRTGDLAKYSKDGNIHFLGRADNQIKISGFRIEPGEIEKCISREDGIRQIAVAAKTNKQHKKFLVAYYVSEKKLDKAELKDKLKSKLPAHMIPQYWVELREMPLTNRGRPMFQPKTILQRPKLKKVF